MNRNWMYLLALMTLMIVRLLVYELHYDQWLLSAHYIKAAAFITSLRSNMQFGNFIGGYVFPAFVGLVLVIWIVEEDKSRIPVQFMLLPLAYIPFSIIGFTLVNAEFQFSYLYVNTLVILTFGYVYTLFWAAIIKLLEKLHLVE